MAAVEVLVDLVRELRAAGVRVDTARLLAAAEALARMPFGDGAGPYWALRCTLCLRPEDLPKFDAVWAAWPAPAAEDGAGQAIVVAAGTPTAAAAVTASPATGVPPSRAAGQDERLAFRDVAELDEAELAEVRTLIALLTPAARRRPVVRRRPARTGSIDSHRTVRLMLRNGGEPSRILRTRRLLRPRRLLLLIDTSGSMAEYSDIFLRFAHAAVAAGPATTEVFTLGTGWTPIGGLLSGRDANAAMRAIAETKADWHGGTRLGESLRDFLRRHGGRSTVRSAIVVICSDGMDRGDQSLLPRQIARVSRLGHAVIWVNPAEGRAGFRPMRHSLRQSLAYVDERLSGHSLASLRALAEVIAR